MNDIKYEVQTTTLKEIADAIRYVTNIDKSIPVKELASALLNGVVVGTAPVATETRYEIDYKTLKEIADALRAIENTTEDIPVAEIQTRIYDIVISIIGKARLGRMRIGSSLQKTSQLGTPVIEVIRSTAPGTTRAETS